jgi:hypothetical protein
MFPDLSMQFSPLWPPWLIVAVIGGTFLATAWGTALLIRKQVPHRWVAILGMLRLTILVVLALILLQPAISYSHTVQPLPELMVLVDTSRSMGQPAGKGGTRLQETLAELQKGQFASALHERFQPRIFRFDQTAAPVTDGELAGLQPTTKLAHLAESLADACTLLKAEGKSTRRVLLVSDGNDRSGTDPAEAARRLGLVVDVLAPSAKEVPAADKLEILDVQGARRVLLGSETHFRVTVRRGRTTGQDEKLSMHLLEDGKEAQAFPLILKAGRTEEALTLPHRPLSIGLKQYEFHLRSPSGKEAAPAGKLSVQVTDSKYEILVLEDSWRWEYKFLHRLFEDDPSFRFTALLSRGKGSFMQFASPDRRVGLVGFPQGRAELESFDLFFLGDINPRRWPQGLAASLAHLITEGGKSLVVIAGPGLARLADVPEVYELLPVDLTRDSGSPVSGPVEVRFRPDAAQSPFFFQLRPGQAPLPGLDQVYPVLRKRPGATVLLEAAKHRNAYGNLIVLAEQTVGRGRVLFVGTDTLWKWHTLAPGDAPSPYGIFWQQAFRALTPQQLRLGSVNLWLTPSRTLSEPDRPITLEAKIKADRPLPQPRLQATVELPDGKRLPLAFSPDGTNPRRFRAALTPSLPGLYHVSATVLADGKTAAQGTATFRVEDTSGTQASTGIDRALLDRLAAATGGKVIDPARPESWPTPASEALPAVTESRTLDLWNSFILLIMLCLLLGTDWVLRLFNGLV